jgi:LmbE family N-acetylglucosaminyl deacetylase
MLELSLNLGSIKAPSVLCIGAHCDDIEIGCGGTLIRIAESCPGARFDWIVFCSDSTRAAESRQAAGLLLGQANIGFHFHEFRDGYLPWEGAAPKELLQKLAQSLSPDVVLTHHADDMHQDHRLVAEITANVFRDHLLLGYEIPKYDGDFGRPNIYVPLDEPQVNRKVAALLKGFPTQAGKHWFTEDTFRGLLRLRGIEAGRGIGHAEAFHGRKIRMQPA